MTTRGPKYLRILVTAALLLGLAAVGAPARAASAAACDEACLKGFMDAYLNALTKHDPSLVPVAKHYRYTENGAKISLGEALWVTFNSYGPYRHDLYDPDTGGVASYVSLMENHEIPFPDLLAVRLKVVNHQITEIETVVNRHNETGYRNLPPPDPSWMQIMNRVEPASTRLSRAELERGALNYMRAFAFHNGALAPFAESCIRLENGNVTATGPQDQSPVPPRAATALGPGTSPNRNISPFILGVGCASQLVPTTSSFYSFITGFEGARFPIVDVQRQVVYAMFDFMRRGNVESWTYQGRVIQMPEGMRYPNEILNSEMFKFVNGKITRIEALFEGPQAYKRGTGWPGGTEPVSRPLDQ